MNGARKDATCAAHTSPSPDISPPNSTTPTFARRLGRSPSTSASAPPVLPSGPGTGLRADDLAGLGRRHVTRERRLPSGRTILQRRRRLERRTGRRPPSSPPPRRASRRRRTTHAYGERRTPRLSPAHYRPSPSAQHHGQHVTAARQPSQDLQQLSNHAVTCSNARNTATGGRVRDADLRRDTASIADACSHRSRAIACPSVWRGAKPCPARQESGAAAAAPGVH
jgi:hypothetical protein